MLLSLLPWAVLVVSLLLFFVSLNLINKQKKKIAALETLVKSLLVNNTKFKKEFSEIHTGAIGMGKKVRQLDDVIKSTQENQLNIAAQTPENRLYTRATKMVELGASLEEVMKECELPKAEAELLMNLRAKISS